MPDELETRRQKPSCIIRTDPTHESSSELGSGELFAQMEINVAGIALMDREYSEKNNSDADLKEGRR